MRLRDHYDWIVLGDDPGALLSASLAAKLGLSVLVLPLYPTSGFKIFSGSDKDDRSDELVLDLESNSVPGLGTGGLWEACLNAVGMTLQEQVQILKASGVSQVVTQHRRVLLDPDRARLFAEFEREWGSESLVIRGLAGAVEHADPLLEKYWLDLPERLTLKSARSELTKDSQSKSEAQLADSGESKKAISGTNLNRLAKAMAKTLGRDRTFAKEWFSESLNVGQWEAERDLAEFCEGVQVAVSDTQGSLSAGSFSVLQQLVLSRTAASFRGGMTAFREYLLKLARRNGADLPPKTECRQIFIQKGRFAGVLPSVRGSMISGTGGILGVPLEYVQAMLIESGRAWGKGFKPSSTPIGWKFTLALTLHPEGVPPGMARRVIWQEKGAPFVEMELVHPSDYGLKDGNRVILFLRTMMPMTEESLTPAYQRLISARLLRKATQISPFLEYHIRRIYPDFREEPSREMREQYGFKALTEIPPQLLCYAGEGIGAQSGVEGLFASSRESFPMFGMHGGAVCALEGVAWVAHRSGLAGPLKS
jgi:hypothetical protein